MALKSDAELLAGLAAADAKLMALKLADIPDPNTGEYETAKEAVERAIAHCIVRGYKHLTSRRNCNA